MGEWGRFQRRVHQSRGNDDSLALGLQGLICRTWAEERKGETVAATLLEVRSVWLGHLHHQAAWLFLGSRLESCTDPPRVSACLGLTSSVKLGSARQFCTCCSTGTVTPGPSRSVEWSPARTAQAAVGWDRGSGRQEGFICMRGLCLTLVLPSHYPASPGRA